MRKTQLQKVLTTTLMEIQPYFMLRPSQISFGNHQLINTSMNRESLCRGASLEHSKFYAIIGFETYLPKVTSRKWITVWTVNICCIHTYNHTYIFSYIHISYHSKQTRIKIHSFCRPFKNLGVGISALALTFKFKDCLLHSMTQF